MSEIIGRECSRNQCRCSDFSFVGGELAKKRHRLDDAASLGRTTLPSDLRMHKTQGFQKWRSPGCPDDGRIDIGPAERLARTGKTDSGQDEFLPSTRRPFFLTPLLRSGALRAAEQDRRGCWGKSWNFLGGRKLSPELPRLRIVDWGEASVFPLATLMSKEVRGFAHLEKTVRVQDGQSSQRCIGIFPCEEPP